MPQDGEMPENEPKEAPTGELTPLEKEEEGYSGTEDDPEEEGAVECDSALDKEEEDFQCPKEEDIVRLEGSPGCKNCPRFLLVGHFRTFNEAQVSGLRLKLGVGVGMMSPASAALFASLKSPGSRGGVLGRWAGAHTGVKVRGERHVETEVAF